MGALCRVGVFMDSVDSVFPKQLNSHFEIRNWVKFAFYPFTSDQNFNLIETTISKFDKIAKLTVHPVPLFQNY